MVLQVKDVNYTLPNRLTIVALVYWDGSHEGGAAAMLVFNCGPKFFWTHIVQANFRSFRNAIGPK